MPRENRQREFRKRVGMRVVSLALLATLAWGQPARYLGNRRKTARRRVSIEYLKLAGRNGDEVNSGDPTHRETEPRHERFARRTMRQLRRRPAGRPDGSGQTFASAVQSGAELTTNLVPSDRLNGTRIEISNPQRDLSSPGLFGVFIDFRVKAVNERVGECRPCCRGQFQGVR